MCKVCPKLTLLAKSAAHPPQQATQLPSGSMTKRLQNCRDNIESERGREERERVEGVEGVIEEEVEYQVKKLKIELEKYIE